MKSSIIGTLTIALVFVTVIWSAAVYNDTAWAEDPVVIETPEVDPPLPPIPPDPPPTVPPSLKTIRNPVLNPIEFEKKDNQELMHFDDFIKDKEAAIKLGKALFWDMQIGSDGQACASCHFAAGADARIRNQLTPGLPHGDTIFGNNPFTGNFDFPQFGPDYTLTPADFPHHVLKDPDDANSRVLRDTDDVVSSMGVFNAQFVAIQETEALDIGLGVFDPVFNLGSIINVRRVEPRNTPTMINAVFTFANFWDGRANFFFNGNNPFGPLDRDSKIFVNNVFGLEEKKIRVPFSSLASQADGPPLSDFEMSFAGRQFRDIGKKMLTLTPLGLQMVSPDDSVLGPLSRAYMQDGWLKGDPGLKKSYIELIKEAFRDEYWNSDLIITFDPWDSGWKTADLQDPRSYPLYPGTASWWPRPDDNPLQSDEFTQMEANFSLFFGLAVQFYEATLVSDDAKFDQVREGRNEFTEQEQLGLDTFMGKGKCINCHSGSEFTNARITAQEVSPNVPGFARENIERMVMGDGKEAIYDNGFYNIGRRPTGEDIGRGGTAPFINPKTGDPFPLSFARLAQLKKKDLLPEDVAKFVPDLPMGVPANFRVAVDGAFKASGLRNVELTGPYFHDGGELTLKQVVQFYDRGGNFRKLNWDDLDPDIEELNLTEEEKDALVAFLLTLTDERVKFEKEPFDHPELFVAKDGTAMANAGEREAFKANPAFKRIKAVGADGRPDPLENFLGVSSIQGDPKIDHFDLFTDSTDLNPSGVYDEYAATATVTLVVEAPGILANDSSPEGNPLTAQLVFGPSDPAAQLDMNPDGSFTYTYTADITSAVEDTFAYVAKDGYMSSAITTVKIKVTPFKLPDNEPVATDDVYEATATFPLVIPAPGVLTNDTDADVDPLTVTLVSGPTSGIATLTLNPDGSFTYNYPDNVAEQYIDSFTYVADDGLGGLSVATVTIKVNPYIKPNNVPNAANDKYEATALKPLVIPEPGVLYNDTDADSDPLAAILVSGPTKAKGKLTFNSTGSFTYTYEGDIWWPVVDTFTYKAFDGKEYSEVATVTIKINPRPWGSGIPLAVDDLATTHSPAKVRLLKNDSCPDGGKLNKKSIVIVEPPANGTLTIKNGIAYYNPNLGFVGVDTFAYTVEDVEGDLSNVAGVTITIEDNPPVAVDDAKTTKIGRKTSISLLKNDTDVEGKRDIVKKSVQIVAQPTNGTVTVKNGTARYVPNEGFAGVDVFTYTVQDKRGLTSNEAIVMVTVQ